MEHGMLGLAKNPSFADGTSSNAAELLETKSIDELRKILSEKETYEAFLSSIEHVKHQQKLIDDLQRETVDFASENFDKQTHLFELRNQCSIIRTTELAAARNKLDELEKEKEEIVVFFSSSSLLQKLHDAMEEAKNESAGFQEQLLQGDIDLSTFLKKYMQLRSLYHKRALISLSAKTLL